MQRYKVPIGTKAILTTKILTYKIPTITKTFLNIYKPGEMGLEMEAVKVIDIDGLVTVSYRNPPAHPTYGTIIEWTVKLGDLIKL